MTQKNILFLSSATNSVAATSHLEHLATFKQYSKHNFFYHNFVYSIEPDFDFTPFDVVVIAHNFWPEILSEAQRAAIRNCSALKIQFLQDEYQYVRTINGYLEEMGINIMFTCVAEADFDTFYPRSIMKSLMSVEPNLTGYVSDRLSDPKNFYTGPRSTDVGYRSRVSPFFLGEIGYEKYAIAEKFKTVSEQSGLTYNISVKEEDRIYGSDWIKFLQSTRVQLGTPSGASVVDMDGSIVQAELDFRHEHPHAPFSEFSDKHLKDVDGKLVIDTVSPRFFEYAATGSAMVLLEGHYGGILVPDQHYIPLRKDYSNIDDVIQKISDTSYCKALADRAHDDLIKSKRYSYENFVVRFDGVVDRYATKAASATPPSQKAFNAQLIETHDQALFFTEDGWSVANTPTGKHIKEQQSRAKTLRAMPLIGPSLRRTGGDTVAVFKHVKLAFRLLRHLPEYRSLGLLWFWNRKTLGNQDIVAFSRDLVKLGIIQSGQAGFTYTGKPFHTRAKVDPENGKLILSSFEAEPSAICVMTESIGDSDMHPPDFWLDVLQQFRSGTLDGVYWDMSSIFPLLQFGVATIVPFTAHGEGLELRSSPDQYFHFPALDALLKLDPESVLYAIRLALSASFGPDQNALISAFEQG